MEIKLKMNSSEFSGLNTSEVTFSAELSNEQMSHLFRFVKEREVIVDIREERHETV